LSDAAAQTAARPQQEGGVAVRLEGVVKRFGEFTAVDGIDLEVREGEFFSMLGPSGRARRPVSG